MMEGRDLGQEPAHLSSGGATPWNGWAAPGKSLPTLSFHWFPLLTKERCRDAGFMTCKVLPSVNIIRAYSFIRPIHVLAAVFRACC